MAKGPAVVIIARHGARLDAADKQWHLTSPTPYDPPLTYGGWSQAKALGLRIAALLHQREIEKASEPESSDSTEQNNGQQTAKGGEGPKKKSKYKVVIHSSPYVRCVQTSTGIAAGMSQFQAGDVAMGSGDAVTRLKVPTPSKERNGTLGASPLSKTPSLSVKPVPVLEPTGDPSLAFLNRSRTRPEKILLRIDAFLGEWLSPDYFEDITPPPNSTMMVAGAKADLLRRGDYVGVQPTAPSSKGNFPGGWSRSPAPSAANGRKTADEKTEDASLPKLGSLAQALPSTRERSNSQGSAFTRRRSGSRDASTKLPSRRYEAPAPAYAVSPADPMPRGYFAHARDACVQVDFHWDSMREPQEWGDGGEYGDEWSTMHKRFRRGLAGMMKWYKQYGSLAPKDQFAGFTFNERSKPSSWLRLSSDPAPNANDEANDDEELVLVLVTHGAGCNALLGAISNQPVLVDVGLAALSMAVRRDEPRRRSSSTPSSPTVAQRRGSVIDPGMSDTYEMKLMASTDHLRANVDPSKPPQPQSPAGGVMAASPSLEYRRRFTGGTNSPSGNSDTPFFAGETTVRSGWNSALGSIRRSSTNGSGTTRLKSNYAAGSSTPRTSSGLWSSTRASSIRDDHSDTPSEDMLLNFDNQNPKPLPRTNSSPNAESQSPVSPSSKPTDGISNTDGTVSPSMLPPPLPSSTPNPTCAETEKEKDDNVAPLRNKNPPAPKRTGSVSSVNSVNSGSNTTAGSGAGNGTAAGAGGLWSSSKTPSAGHKLWGPPRLDDVYEHGRGPKRRWTVSERE